MIKVIKNEEVSVIQTVSQYIDDFKDYIEWLQNFLSESKQDCMAQLKINTITYLDENNQLKIENKIDLQVAPVRNLKNESEDIE